MGSSAGLQVEPQGFDEADLVASLRGRQDAQSGRLFAPDGAYAHRPRAPDDLVRSRLGGHRLFGSDLAIEVDGRAVGTEMEALGARGTYLDEGARQEVLAVMLLTMILPARGIDDPRNPIVAEGRAEDVQRSPSCSTTATTGTPESEPVSQGWPPLSA